jgi:HD-like signal output (HDOD) protein
MRAYVAEHGGTFVDAERDLFGMDHAAIGALVAERWNLPPDIVDGVARHHALAMEAPSAVLDVVIVANCIAKALSHGLGSEGFNFPVDKPAVRRLRLGFPAIGRICLRTDDLLRELQESMA